MSSGSGSSSSSPTKARHQLRPPHPNGNHHRSRTRTPSPHPPPSPRLQPLPPPLLLTIRFSNGLPDLHLDIPRPTTTPVIALKHLLRSRLEEPTSQRRLRFIHAGRILPDDASLSSVLRALPAPPPPTTTTTKSNSNNNNNNNPAAAAASSGKGKAIEGAAPAPPRVYVNCSIGDLLTDAELAAEAAAAANTHAASPLSPTTPASPLFPSLRSSSSTTGPPLTPQQQQQQRGPRGFDRLLAAGFTAAEVNQLRLQFRSIQASRYTPDTMPSPDTLRGMEDAWMDNNGGGGGGSGAYPFGDSSSSSAAAAAAAAADGGADAGDDSGINGVMDIMLRGMLIGFVWPLGAFGWLVREEGLYSRRWKVFISFGFVLSLVIGLIRSISGEHA